MFDAMRVRADKNSGARSEPLKIGHYKREMPAV
jgi:hypothetical protein